MRLSHAVDVFKLSIRWNVSYRRSVLLAFPLTSSWHRCQQ